MNDKRKVETLFELHLKKFFSKGEFFLSLEAKGVSRNEYTGYPMLIPKQDSNRIKENGIFELDYIIEGRSGILRRELHWSVSNIYALRELPKIKAIKVNALNNADIIIL